MLRLDKVIKPWKESAALNDHINLYGFWNETAFLRILAKSERYKLRHDAAKQQVPRVEIV